MSEQDSKALLVGLVHKLSHFTSKTCINAIVINFDSMDKYLEILDMCDPRFWNSLLLSGRSSNQPSTLKSELKTYYFQIALSPLSAVLNISYLIWSQAV